VEAKILEEIKENFGHKEKPWILSVDDVKSLFIFVVLYVRH